MQELALTDSRSHFIPQSGKTIDVPHLSENLYSIVEQEVDLGVQALKRESNDMAVTMVQSALHKFTIDEPFYDHLGANLGLSYKLQVGTVQEEDDTALALDFLRAARG